MSSEIKTQPIDNSQYTLLPTLSSQNAARFGKCLGAMLDFLDNEMVDATEVVLAAPELIAALQTSGAFTGAETHRCACSKVDLEGDPVFVSWHVRYTLGLVTRYRYEIYARQRDGVSPLRDLCWEVLVRERTGVKRSRGAVSMGPWAWRPGLPDNGRAGPNRGAADAPPRGPGGTELVSRGPAPLSRRGAFTGEPNGRVGLRPLAPKPRQ